MLADRLRRWDSFYTRLDLVKDLIKTSVSRRGFVTVKSINTPSYDTSNCKRGLGEEGGD